MTYKFIFVDDEELLRKNLPYMTDWSALGFEFAGSFSTATEAMKYIKQNKVDLVLSDIRLGEESGLELAEKLNNEFPRILVVLISAYKEFEYAKKAIECHVFSSPPTESHWRLRGISFGSVSHCCNCNCN